MQIIKLKEVLIKTELDGFTIHNLIDASQFQNQSHSVCELLGGLKQKLKNGSWHERKVATH